MSEFLNPGHFVPNKRGRIPTILFVATTVGATAAAFVFAPKVGATDVIGNGTATAEYGVPVERTIAATCDKITGVGESDYVASVAASEMIDENGLTQVLRFGHPVDGTELLVKCVSYQLPFFNNNNLL